MRIGGNQEDRVTPKEFIHHDSNPSEVEVCLVTVPHTPQSSYPTLVGVIGISYNFDVFPNVPSHEKHHIC